MPQISRVGDTNQVGGQIIRGANTVFANNIKVGLHVSPITPHSPFKGKHKTAKTTDGSPTVFCEGVPVLRVGSGNDCGHSINQGSPDIFVP
jgi:uncharacterized Zn-binding protein involved in type VI secretion